MWPPEGRLPGFAVQVGGARPWTAAGPRCTNGCAIQLDGQRFDDASAPWVLDEDRYPQGPLALVDLGDLDVLDRLPGAARDGGRIMVGVARRPLPATAVPLLAMLDRTLVEDPPPADPDPRTYIFVAAARTPAERLGRSVRVAPLAALTLTGLLRATEQLVVSGGWGRSPPRIRRCSPVPSSPPGEPGDPVLPPPIPFRPPRRRSATHRTQPARTAQRVQYRTARRLAEALEIARLDGTHIHLLAPAVRASLVACGPPSITSPDSLTAALRSAGRGLPPGG